VSFKHGAPYSEALSEHGPEEINLITEVSFALLSTLGHVTFDTSFLDNVASESV
jgi:hypothetical protein